MPLNGSETSSPPDVSPEEKLIPDPLWTCEGTICEDSRNCIFSRGSEDGHRRCAWHIGPPTDLFGQEVAPVNHSVTLKSLMEERKATAMKETFGQISAASSESVRLTQSLANRFQALLPLRGKGRGVQWIKDNIGYQGDA